MTSSSVLDDPTLCVIVSDKKTGGGVSFFKKIVSKKSFAILDIGSQKTVLLIGVKTVDGSFQVIGAGDSQTRGIQGGEIQNLGDVVESVAEALRKSEQSAGVKAREIYFNVDDSAMRSARASGTKILAGEGEIQPSDVEEAVRAAERDMNCFEKMILYSKPVAFTVDDRDRIENPIGVFGGKLEVELHLLQARSDRCDAWQRVIHRCQLDRGVPVPSAWSVAYGVLPPTDRDKTRLIIDWGEDFANIFIFAKNAIRDHRVFLTDLLEDSLQVQRVVDLAKELIEKNGPPTELLITGDRAREGDLVSAVSERSGFSFRVASPVGISKLSEPRFASLAGLFSVAEELERKAPLLETGRGLLMSVKQRALSYIQEYF